MSFPKRNSNFRGRNDEDDCVCWPPSDEAVDQQILDNLKASMDKNARELQALRDRHAAEHRKYADLKSSLEKELAERKAQLAIKRNPRISGCEKTNKAIEQMVGEIDGLRLTVDPVAAHRMLRDLLIAELTVSVDHLESLTNNQDCLGQDQKRLECYRDCNAQLKKQLQDLKGKLKEDIPEVCNPELSDGQNQNLPCPDCSKDDPALARKELELHHRIDALTKVDRPPARRSVLAKLPPQMVQNLEGMFVGTPNKKFVEKKIFTKVITNYRED